MRDSCGWLLRSLQQQGSARSWLRPAKRTWALLESNPGRNNRLKTHRNDGRGAGGPEFSFRLYIGLIDLLMPRKTDADTSYVLVCKCFAMPPAPCNRAWSEALAVVDVVKEVVNMPCRVVSIAIAMEVDLLTLERSHKAFR